jgi:hypothetical protein
MQTNDVDTCWHEHHSCHMLGNASMDHCALQLEPIPLAVLYGKRPVQA